MYSGFFGNLPPARVLKSNAGLVENSNNPDYTIAMFIEAYPEFTNKVSDGIITKWIALANDCFNINKYGSYWELAMGLFVAHNLILKLKMGNAETSMITYKEKGGTIALMMKLVRSAKLSRIT